MSVYYPRSLVLLQSTFEDFWTLPADVGRTGSLAVIPLSCEWEVSPADQADEATVTLSFDALPLDPRTLRSARLLIYAADVLDPRVDLSVSNDQLVRFVGHVDEPQVRLDDRGGEIVLSARDYSGRLIAAPWMGHPVAISRPLSRVIRGVIEDAGVVGYRDLQISTPDGDPDLGRELGKRQWTPGGRSAWDVINELARLAGMEARFELDALVLRRPTRVQDRSIAAFLYGDNVERLTLRRNLNPVARQAVKVRAFDAGARRVREVTWPRDGQAPGGTLNLTLPQGAWSERTLLRWAEGYYNALGQEEMRGRLETVVMRDRPDDDATDLMALRSGDILSVRIRSEQADRVAGMSRGQLMAYLRSQGLAPSVAEALAEAWLDAETLATTYAVSRVHHRLDHEAGYSASIDFRTFLTPQR